MPAYSFKKRFVPMVLDGSKRHTIRADRQDGMVPKIGEWLSLYFAMRTKQCQFLLASPNTGTQRIVILPKLGRITLDGTAIAADEMDSLAWRDGFRPLPDSFDGAFDQMRRYWTVLHPKVEKFAGNLVHWAYDVRVMDRNQVPGRKAKTNGAH